MLHLIDNMRGAYECKLVSPGEPPDASAAGSKAAAVERKAMKRRPRRILDRQNRPGFSSADPTVRIEGTEVMAGTLAAIECGGHGARGQSRR
jgi:hypothetical protein